MPLATRKSTAIGKRKTSTSPNPRDRYFFQLIPASEGCPLIGSNLDLSNLVPPSYSPSFTSVVPLNDTCKSNTTLLFLTAVSRFILFETNQTHFGGSRWPLARQYGPKQIAFDELDRSTSWLSCRRNQKAHRNIFPSIGRDPEPIFPDLFIRLLFFLLFVPSFPLAILFSFCFPSSNPGALGARSICNSIARPNCQPSSPQTIAP